MTSEKIATHYGNRLRLRINGILIENDCVLMIRHKGLGEDGYLWSPPGGGMEYGTSVLENLKREFHEETGLEIEVGDFLFTCEYLNPPLHAVEMFFKVKRVAGSLIVGIDPELSNKDQIIELVKFLSLDEIRKIPKSAVHKILYDVKSLNTLLNKNGYYAI